MRVKSSSIVETDAESDAEVAVELAGFGKFNIKVAVLCGLIFMNTGFSISSVGFVLPSATCDFNLTTMDKGRISSAPILGMLIGSYFWGCLADLEGRKLALLAALFSHGLFELISSVIPNYWGFIVFQFFCGVSINGQSNILFTYLGEFQSKKMRERIMCWMEMAWSLGLIALPLVGWGVIPLNFSFTYKTFFFRSWNLFVAVCAIPSILIGFWLLTFPETPKYLAESGKDTQLVKTLEIMYKLNTGKSFNEYIDLVVKSGKESLIRRLKFVQTENFEGRRVTRTEKSISLVRNIYFQSFTLIKLPFLMKTCLVCTIMFCLASSYYALMLWFPELFQRFAKFEINHPNVSTSVCKVSSSINQTISVEKCPLTISNDVYIHTLILGVGCLPLSIILPLFVRKLGYKFYLVISSLIAGLVTVGLFFVNSSIQNLILSCIFEAFSSVGMSIVLCIVVELYPTNLRVMAAALCSVFARFGALVGNTLFGYLIDGNCSTLISIIAIQLFACCLLGLLIPLKRSAESSSEESKSSHL